MDLLGTVVADFRRGWSGSSGRALIWGALLALCISVPFALAVTFLTPLGSGPVVALTGVLQFTLGMIFAGWLGRRGK